MFDGVDQQLRAAVQPTDRPVGIGRWLALVDCAGVEIVVDPVGDDLRRPTVTATDLAKQLGKAPARTGRHRGGRVAAADQLAKGAILLP